MQKNNWPATASLGVATYKTLPLSVDEIIKKADELMYAAKEEGKNRIKHYLFDAETTIKFFDGNKTDIDESGGVN